MALINWTDQFSVNIVKIDEQHKGLIDLLNKLHESMKTGKGKEVISEVLNSLVTYTKTHFATEEQLFKTHGYPGNAVHSMEHAKLTQQVAKVQQDFLKGEKVLTMDVLNFLKDWLNNHIMKSDKQYSAFLNAKGVK